MNSSTVDLPPVYTTVYSYSYSTALVSRYNQAPECITIRTHALAQRLSDTCQLALASLLFRSISLQYRPVTRSYSTYRAVSAPHSRGAHPGPSPARGQRAPARSRPRTIAAEDPDSGRGGGTNAVPLRRGAHRTPALALRRAARSPAALSAAGCVYTVRTRPASSASLPQECTRLPCAWQPRRVQIVTGAEALIHERVLVCWPVRRWSAV